VESRGSEVSLLRVYSAAPGDVAATWPLPLPPPDATRNPPPNATRIRRRRAATSECVHIALPRSAAQPDALFRSAAQPDALCRSLPL